MEVTGKVKRITATRDVSATFQARELHVVTDEQYPQIIEIQFVQDKCNLLNTIAIDSVVTVGINLRGREWTNPQGEIKVFTTLQGWKINIVQAAEAQPQPHHANHPTNTPPANQPAPQPFQPTANFNEEEDDDLPF